MKLNEKNYTDFKKPAVFNQQYYFIYFTFQSIFLEIQLLRNYIVEYCTPITTINLTFYNIEPNKNFRG